MQREQIFVSESNEVSGLVGDVLNHAVLPFRGNNELQFLLQRVSAKCLSCESIIIWFDVSRHLGGVLNQPETPEQLISSLQEWVNQRAYSSGSNWIRDLDSLISKYTLKNRDLQKVFTTLQSGRLVAVLILLCNDPWNACLNESLRQDVQTALPVALALYYRRIQPDTMLDSLTSLSQRDEFILQVEDEIKKNLGKEHAFAVALIDLDRFMLVNDAFGPVVADEMLRRLSQRMVDVVSSNDLVARLGGDEFAILIRDISELGNLTELSAKLAAIIRNPISVYGYTARITGSIGVAAWSPEVGKSHQLIRNANRALDYVKHHGKDGLRVYDNTLNASLSKMTMEDALEKALERQEFTLVYQPRVSVAHESIEGAEALIRWNHPQRGLISPSDFIPVAEESRLILKIGDWVLHEVCRQLHEWKQAGVVVPRIAVNVSPKQLVRHRFIEKLDYWMSRFEISPKSLELEITETALLEYGDEMISNVGNIRDRGIQVAVDDFGTGYSSLEILKRFPLDYLKIDQSFVQDLNVRNRAIVSMIIQLAHKIDSKVIAEGVETTEQRDFLMEHGCDEMQGYLYSRPLSPEDFVLRFCKKTPEKSK